MIDKFFKKEKPMTGMSGMGGGFARFKSGSSAFSASGGTKFVLSGYTYHLFTSSGSLVVESGSADTEYLIVGGGGGGGGFGGGGAGGVIGS